MVGESSDHGVAEEAVGGVALEVVVEEAAGVADSGDAVGEGCGGEESGDEGEVGVEGGAAEEEGVDLEEGGKVGGWPSEEADAEPLRWRPRRSAGHAAVLRRRPPATTRRRNFNGVIGRTRVCRTPSSSFRWEIGHSGIYLRIFINNT